MVIIHEGSCPDPKMRHPDGETEDDTDDVEANRHLGELESTGWDTMRSVVLDGKVCEQRVLLPPVDFRIIPPPTTDSELTQLGWDSPAERVTFREFEKRVLKCWPFPRQTDTKRSIERGFQSLLVGKPFVVGWYTIFSDGSWKFEAWARDMEASYTVL